MKRIALGVFVALLLVGLFCVSACSAFEEKGEDGVGIEKIEKTESVGLVDTYTITLTDGTTSTFTVTNGKDGKDGKSGTDSSSSTERENSTNYFRFDLLGDGTYVVRPRCKDMPFRTVIPGTYNGKKVTTIGWAVFMECWSIEELVISENITTINSSAFEECYFSSVTLPVSLKTIESSAFGENARLETINYNGTKKQWNEISKDEYWIDNDIHYTVHCTDGDIEN